MSEDKSLDSSHPIYRNDRPSVPAVLALAVIFALALALRLQAAVFFPAQPIADSADYHRLARGLVEGRGYVGEDGKPTAWRPPGYPFFVAGVYAIVGVVEQRAYVVQAVMGSMTVLALMALAFLIAGKREALIAGLIAAIYPGFFWLPRVLLSENLSLFLTMFALVLAVLLAQDCRWLTAIALGLVLGLSILARGSNFFVAAMLFAGIAFSLWRSGRSSARNALILLSSVLTIAVVLTPWTIRNYSVFHRFVPVATQEGMALYSSYWPPQQGQKLIWGNLPGREDPVVDAASQTGNEVDVSDNLKKATLTRLSESPGRFFHLLPAKMIALVVPFDWEWFPHRAGTSRSLNLGYMLILIPALIGLFDLRRRRAPHQWVLWVVPISVLVQAVIFYGSPRFRLPAEISAVVWASAGVTALIRMMKRSDS